MAALKRRTKARKTVGQCKKCWDHAKIKAIHPIENIVSTELKDEHAKQTTATLTESAKIWRASHSSPIVAKSKYTVSPSVDKILFPVQPEQITLQIPKSLLCMKSKLSNQPPTSISRLKYHEIHCERRNTILLVIKSGQNIWQQEGEDEKRDDF
eukprot:948242_1